MKNLKILLGAVIAIAVAASANAAGVGLQAGNLTTLYTDPTISSGGSATTGAIFFGTNNGSRYIGYDPTTGGTGGYSLGSTFGSSDTLYAGPTQVNNGPSIHVLLKAAASGTWSLTFPTGPGSSGYVFSTDGAGNTSWIPQSAGTSGSPTAKVGPTVVNGSASTFMRSDAAPPIDLTANYIWTGLHTLQTDPVISSGGSATTGAIFFGTNNGSRYIGYDPTTGGTGGYSLGSTFSQTSDILYSGPIRVNYTAGASGVTIYAPSTGIWNLTLPTSAGTNTYALTTNGSGATSWTNLGTGPANPSATAGPTANNGSATSFMRSDATPAVQKGTNAQFGIVEGDGISVTCATGVCSAKGPTPAGGFNYIALSGGAHPTYLEYGGVALSGGTITVTWPQGLFSGVATATATAVTAGSCVITETTLTTTQGTFNGGAGCAGTETVLWQMIGS